MTENKPPKSSILSRMVLGAIVGMIFFTIGMDAISGNLSLQTFITGTMGSVVFGFVLVGVQMLFLGKDKKIFDEKDEDGQDDSDAGEG